MQLAKLLSLLLPLLLASFGVTSPTGCRACLGANQVQMSQLRRDLGASKEAGVVWQVVGNTVVMGPLNTPDVETAAQQRGQVASTLLQVSTHKECTVLH